VKELQSSLESIQGPDFDINSITEKYSLSLLKLSSLKVQDECQQREIKLLNRRLESAQEDLKSARKDLEILDKTSFQKIARLCKKEQSLKAAVEALQCQVDESVPMMELNQAQKKYSDLNTTYVHLLGKKAEQVCSNIDLENLKTKINDLIEYTDAKLRSAILNERQHQERISSLEQANTDLIKEKIELESQLSDVSVKLAMSSPPHIILNQSKSIRDNQIQIATLKEELDSSKIILQLNIY
jgi:chromosome segregation ATPase